MPGSRADRTSDGTQLKSVAVEDCASAVRAKSAKVVNELRQGVELYADAWQGFRREPVDLGGR